MLGMYALLVGVDSFRKLIEKKYYFVGRVE